MGRFVHNGIEYEELPNGKARIIGPAGGQPITLGTPDPVKGQTDAVNLRLKQLEEASKRSELNDAPIDRANADAGLTTRRADIKFRPLEQARKLADDFRQEQAVKDYNSAIGNYGSLLKTKPTPQGDLSLIYSFAKIMDPGSVVREGEMDLAKSTSPIVQQVYARFGKELDGGGALSDESRQRLRLEAANKMGALNEAYLTARVNYKKMADRYNLNPLDVVGEHAGLRYQDAESKLLGRPVQQLDYNGMPKAPSANAGPDGIQRSTRMVADPSPANGGIATGATAQGEAPPPAFQRAMSDWVEANRGKMTPESYINAFNGLAQVYSYPGRANEGNAAREVDQINKGAPYGGVARGERQATGAEQFMGDVFTSDPGATLAGFVNANMLGIPDALSGGRMDAIRQESPIATSVGDILGSLTGVAGLSNGLVKTGLAKDIPQALLRANLGYGTVRGAAETPENPILGGLVGAGVSAAGEGVGRGIVAPAVKAIAQSRGGQAVGNSVRGIFGKRQMPVVAPLSQPEQMIVSAVGDRGPQTMASLREASRLGLPFTLADANPNLRALAGSAVRKSPNVRQLAEDTLRPRAVGQIDRLQNAITRDFGNPANIPERSDALIEQARNASRPFYEQAYSAPGASSVNVDDILQTPLGKAALERARTQAMNDRMDPTALGIDLNDIGEPVLTRVPSFETLDRVKKAFDDIASEGRTPFGTFQPNAEQATAARLADDLRTRIDEVNPAYAQARSAFAGPSGEREALNMGTKAGNQSADQVGYTLKNLSPARAQQYRLGALSDISERANRVRYNSNPYEAIAGSPEARARLEVLWPQSAPRFTRQADLEADMGRTFTEALGGSPTQARNMADQAFDVGPVPAAAIDMANGFMTGSPPVATLSRVGGNFLKDAYRLGLGQKKADAIGPVLLNPDVAQVAQIFSDIRKNTIKSGMLGRKAAKQGKTVGDITASMFAAPVTSYILDQ